MALSQLPCNLVEVMGQLSNKNTCSLICRLHDSLAGPLHRRTPRKSSRKQRQRRLPAPQAAELTASYQAGATLRDVASQFGVHRETAAGILERHGVARRNQPLSADQIAEAMTLYQEGLSLAAVGEHFGVHASTIWRTFLKFGVTTRDCQGR